MQGINISGARILFVGLGYPKQERGMAAYWGKIQAKTIGVRVASDYHAEMQYQAPGWMQRAGPESRCPNKSFYREIIGLLEEFAPSWN